MKELVTGCTHCGICTENCGFLKKYDLTIGDIEKLSRLAYHCFLCGKCSKVCPQGIDGREAVLQIRRQQVKEAGGFTRSSRKYRRQKKLFHQRNRHF